MQTLISSTAVVFSLLSILFLIDDVFGLEIVVLMMFFPLGKMGPAAARDGGLKLLRSGFFMLAPSRLWPLGRFPLPKPVCVGEFSY